ncbi:Disease resistance protein (TIR-NBS-LRR class) [Quillaja saponaria]|uniref:Disease resistance protein (TIR-NBS-LRR class) n=1 Tax=Quillaja saponaria TaxID=32244 RepID=A0AAD7PNR9_QUISA|nr:Disease resistance protein (TIR-NBS-LRR class) [Quillaja saponaria]
MLLVEKSLRIGSLGSTFVEERLRRKKVLLVFDNVDDSSQLEYLLGSGDACFGSGSRVMVTSRDRRVFAKADEIYEVPKMNFQESLQLFNLNAFKQDNPVEDLRELSKRMVYYCDGIPLALKVLGSFLYGRSKEEWESCLRNIEKAPHKKIVNALKLSYDGLDYKEKAIFLDIACFFAGDLVDKVKAMLGEFITVVIPVLIDLSLISISQDKKVEIHDLIKEMGLEIVRQQSPIEPGKRSRLWCSKDVGHMLKNNTGTDAVECISLDMYKFKEVHLSDAAFARMPNLRFLKFYNSGPFSNGIYSSEVKISHGIGSVSDKLRLFHWDGYPSRYMPVHFCPENLVELVMRGSHVDQLWDGVQYLPNLRTINLRYSKHLTGIPNLSRAPNLQYVNLSGCSKLKEFPVTSTNLDVLDLCKTAIVEVPSSVATLTKLSKLDLSYCESLTNLTSSIC